ncbi:MAG: radical SAM protein, partial [Acidobacteriota bacterium]
TLETAERIGNWIDARVDEVRPGKLALMFFGGEPLLNLPVMYYLAERAHTIARSRELPVSISIVTNGLLLTKEIVERLLPLGLTSVKVTLDGDRDTHNRMRPLRGGQGTFDKIVRNVAQVADLCAVSIGGNFDLETVESYPALLKFLSAQPFAPSIAKVAFKPIIRDTKPQPGKGFIPLQHVDASGKPLGGTCMTVAGTGASSPCDGCNLLDEKMAWLREETKRHGFPTIDGIHMGPCEIHRDHSYTVGPDGSLYACPGFTGDKGQSIGHIDGRHDAARAQARSAFDQLAAWKECQDCAFIPVCAGGCTVAAHSAFGDINKPNCHKRSLEQGVAALAREAAAVAFTTALAS